MEKYTKWLRGRGKRDNTIRRYVTISKKFIAWYEESTEHSPFLPKDITTSDIQDFQNYLLRTTKENRVGKKYTPSSVVNYMEGLKTFFRYLQDNKEIRENPTENLRVQKVQKNNTRKWLIKEEEEKLTIYMNDFRVKKKSKWRFERNRALLSFMLQAGLKIGEALGLELSDIVEKTITIRDGKGGKLRSVPMNSDLQYYYKEWLVVRKDLLNEYSPFIFTSQKSLNLTRSGVEHIFKQIRKDTGLTNLTPHQLRHTFCRKMYVLTKDIELVAQLAGHEDLDTTRIYITSSNEDHLAAVEKISSGHYKELS